MEFVESYFDYDLVMSEVEPYLQHFGEQCYASWNFPHRRAHFEHGVHRHYRIRRENEPGRISVT